MDIHSTIYFGYSTWAYIFVRIFRNQQKLSPKGCHSMSGRFSSPSKYSRRALRMTSYGDCCPLLAAVRLFILINAIFFQNCIHLWHAYLLDWKIVGGSHPNADEAYSQTKNASRNASAIMIPLTNKVFCFPLEKGLLIWGYIVFAIAITSAIGNLSFLMSNAAVPEHFGLHCMYFSLSILNILTTFMLIVGVNQVSIHIRIRLFCASISFFMAFRCQCQQRNPRLLVPYMICQAVPIVLFLIPILIILSPIGKVTWLHWNHITRNADL